MRDVKMKTLKQLVDEQKWNDVSDVQFVKTFFYANDMGEEAT